MATATDAKPKKPYPEFLLFAHQTDQWAKKIRGKQWFFGVWSVPDAALTEYLDEVDEIQAGRDPSPLHRKALRRSTNPRRKTQIQAAGEKHPSANVERIFTQKTSKTRFFSSWGNSRTTKISGNSLAPGSLQRRFQSAACVTGLWLSHVHSCESPRYRTESLDFPTKCCHPSPLRFFPGDFCGMSFRAVARIGSRAVSTCFRSC